MKKSVIVLATIAVALLIISTATAVPHVHSEPAMKIVNDVEKNKSFFEEKIEDFSDKIGLDLGSRGIIDTIIAIIEFIIGLIMGLIQFIADLMQIGNLILALIDAINALISIITQFIEFIMGIFNPEGFALIDT